MHQKTSNQWGFLVPLIGGRYHIIPHLAVYTTYIPGNSIDQRAEIDGGNLCQLTVEETGSRKFRP